MFDDPGINAATPGYTQENGPAVLAAWQAYQPRNLRRRLPNAEESKASRSKAWEMCAPYFDVPSNGVTSSACDDKARKTLQMNADFSDRRCGGVRDHRCVGVPVPHRSASGPRRASKHSRWPIADHFGDAESPKCSPFPASATIPMLACVISGLAQWS